MDLSTPVDLYRERLGHGLTAEPLNDLSGLAFPPAAAPSPPIGTYRLRHGLNAIAPTLVTPSLDHPRADGAPTR